MNGTARIHFDDFEFDPRSGQLLRNGQPIRIQPQPLRVLKLLLERPGQTIPREELREHIWGGATYVEFDQGLNYCIRHIRQALRDNAVDPLYIETLPRQGYRFIADVVHSATAEKADAIVAPITHIPASPSTRTARKPPLWLVATALCALLAIAAVAVYLSLRAPPAGLKYTQLTDFTDSATAPALSPDGRMVAFFRGSNSFLTAGQIYVKMLPDGEPRRLTRDTHPKYGLAFSPDGSQIAYTVLHGASFATYAVPVLGGDPSLFLKNAAGLTWLDQRQLLFSQIRGSGIHMGVVTGTATRENFREVYFPPHDRAMAHYSYASPDRKSALLVEMDEKGWWTPCRLISLDGRSPVRPAGPEGLCTSAGWSPDGSRMYFTVSINGRSHLWGQRFPNGKPEQITFGPTEEEGVAVEQKGRSLITSVGVRQSAIWIHDPNGDRPLTSEGEILALPRSPALRVGDKFLYYLLLHQAAGSVRELWRMDLDSRKSEAVFPGTSMLAFDISPGGKQAVYTSALAGKPSLWIAPIDKSSPPRRIGRSGETRPCFGPRGQIFFQALDGNFNYLEQMNPDGSGRSKLVSFPILDLLSISPGRRWIMANATVPGGTAPVIMAIPTGGGPPVILSESYCVPIWSPSGKWLFISVEPATRTSPGRSLAIPIGPGETLPPFPPAGIPPQADPSIIPGAQSVARADLVPGLDPSHYVYVKTSVHRNLYRISLR
ncbi:MAG TPA: winged helix-turn-helix domain-containing protein, partial [Bryobacteraceae bacterium]